MSSSETTKRPLPVTLIAMYFLFAAAYLWSLATVLIVSPGKLSLMLGSRFMYGLELAGPYMMLLVGCGYGLIGWGLYRLHSWARWLAMLALVLAVGSLVPVISTVQFDVSFFVCGIEIALLAAAGFYLAQAPTAIEAFANNASKQPRPGYTDPYR